MPPSRSRSRPLLPPFPGARLLPAAALLVAACLLAALPSAAPADEGGLKLKAGDPAPDFTLKDLGTGREMRLSEHLGNGPVVLEFWAPWCDICKGHLGNLARLQEAWRGKGVTVLSVVVNFKTVDEVRAIACAKGVNYPVLLDPDLVVAGRYGLAGFLPLMVLVDGKGVIRFAHFGEFDPGSGPRPHLEALTVEVPAPVPFSYGGAYCGG